MRETERERVSEEWKEEREAERQMDRNVIYRDLGSCLRTMKGGTRERWQ